jgi:hypothetical protein
MKKADAKYRVPTATARIHGIPVPYAVDTPYFTSALFP